MTTFSLPIWTYSQSAGERLRRAVTSITAIAGIAGFVLLLLATSLLLIRPGDLISSLDGTPMYEWVMMACMLVAMPSIIKRLTIKSLQDNAIVVLVLLLLPAVMLSHLAHGDTYSARIGGFEIAKAILFFVLTVSVVDCPQRLRWMLWTIAACIVVQAALAVMQYHGLLHLAALGNIVQQTYDGDNTEPTVLMRLCGSGVFNDPNDFALILVVAMAICAQGLADKGVGPLRMLFLAAFALLAYALFLTHSRGGMIAAGTALTVYLAARFGWRNAVPLMCALAPVLLLYSSGRASHVELDDPEDTFQTRLELWNDSFDVFRAWPICGIGHEMLTDEIGQVSHNSYLHAYAEMGILGGTIFVGAFYLVLRGLKSASPVDPELRPFYPCVFAIVTGYAVGLFSLSRCYTVPTQMILALGAVFLLLTMRAGPANIPRFDGACVRRVTAVGLLLLLVSYLFLRMMLSDRGIQ